MSPLDMVKSLPPGYVEAVFSRFLVTAIVFSGHCEPIGAVPVVRTETAES